MGALDKLNDVAGNLDGGTMFAAFDSGVLAKVYFFLKVGFWIGVVFIGGAAVYKFFLQYKVKLTIYKRVGTGSIEIINDMAKIETDEQNKTKLVLYKTKKGKNLRCTLPVPEAKYKGKKGKSDHYTLWLDDNMELHPVNNPLAKISLFSAERGSTFGSISSARILLASPLPPKYSLRRF